MKRLGLCYTVSNNGYETLDSLHMEMSCVEDVRPKLSFLQYDAGERYFIVFISHCAKGIVLELTLTRAGGRGPKGDDNDTASILIPSGVYVDAATLSAVVENVKKELNVSPLRRKSIVDSAYLKYFEKEYKDSEMQPVKEETGRKAGFLNYGPGTDFPTLEDALGKIYGLAALPHSPVILLDAADKVTLRPGMPVSQINPSGVKDSSEFKSSRIRVAPKAAEESPATAEKPVTATEAAIPAPEKGIETPSSAPEKKSRAGKTSVIAVIAFLVGAGLGLGAGSFIWKAETPGDEVEKTEAVAKEAPGKAQPAAETVADAPAHKEPIEAWQDKARSYIDSHDVLDRREVENVLPQLVEVWDALNTFDGEKLQELNSQIESVKLKDIVKELLPNPQIEGRRLCADDDFRITLASYVGRIRKTSK
ncbi:MAG: hypothetical protein MJY61_01205 [Bacteroidales bacterium]|nr:hypothetical protein [Bacteroidales bacterium]